MNDNEKPVFPQVKKTIDKLIEDEDGSIPAGKLLTIGTLVIIMAGLLSIDVFAKHGSHSSHSSHASHSSSSYHGSHSNSHSSHSQYHGSHASHGSHTSHSNTTSHSNANYSASGDYSTPTAPSASTISGKTISTPEVLSNTTSGNGMVVPDIIHQIQTPQIGDGNPVYIVGQPLNTPLPTNETVIASPEIPGVASAIKQDNLVLEKITLSETPQIDGKEKMK